MNALGVKPYAPLDSDGQENRNRNVSLQRWGGGGGDFSGRNSVRQIF